MRVLLIYPNTAGLGEIPINYSYLQSILKQNGHQVEIFDISSYKAFAERSDKVMTKFGLCKEIERRDDLPPLILKETSPVDDIANKVEDFQPGVVGVTSFTSNYETGIQLLEGLKKRFKDAFTIYGGIHTTLMPEEVIKEPAVDAICVGEGEEMLLELCNGLDAGSDITHTKNLWIKRKNTVIRNSLRKLIDLNDLPFQDFDGFNDRNFYRPLAGKLYRMGNVIISRGCAFRCSYCINHTLQEKFDGLGKYHRKMSVDRAISNLVHLKEKYRLEMVRFWDEDFTTIRVDYLKDLADEYKEKVGLPFLIFAHVKSLSEEKTKILKDMGCKTMAVGIESGSPYIREKVLNRKISNKKHIEAFKVIRDYGIRVSAYNMIGLPHETRKEIFETIELNRLCKPDTPSVSFFEPYPNTRIYEQAVREGYLKANYMPVFDFLAPHINEKLITHNELKGLIKTFALYTRVPKILYPIVRLCEYDNMVSDFLRSILFKFYGGK